jgi:hypothetical protein
MTSKMQKLKTLNALSKASHMSVQSRMQEVKARQSQLTAKLKDLDFARRRRDETMLAENDPALFSGADPQWHQWIESRKIAIQTELANLRVQELATRQELALAFGREQVTDKLVDHQRSVFHQQLDRARDQTS